MLLLWAPRYPYLVWVYPSREGGLFEEKQMQDRATFGVFPLLMLILYISSVHAWNLQIPKHFGKHGSQKFSSTYVSNRIAPNKVRETSSENLRMCQVICQIALICEMIGHIFIFPLLFPHLIHSEQKIVN